MRNLLLITTIGLGLYSCDIDENEGFFGYSNRVNIDGLAKEYKVLVIDSCEYIVYDATKGHQGFGFMAHKGNCKFCKQRK